MPRRVVRIARIVRQMVTRRTRLGRVQNVRGYACTCTHLSHCLSTLARERVRRLARRESFTIANEEIALDTLARGVTLQTSGARQARALRVRAWHGRILTRLVKIRRCG